jgi:DNA-binding transcriptional regulator YiaG
MFQRNLDVRKEKGTIPMWVIAERLGVSEGTLRNWMRTEMEAEKKARVLLAIVELQAELKEYGVSKITKDSLTAI